jgi:hypothetical protein
MLPVSPTPARLPLGTLVGPWRVLERLGLGAHGAAYRALHCHSPSSPVALKLALHPGNPPHAAGGGTTARALARHAPSHRAAWTRKLQVAIHPCRRAGGPQGTGGYR